MSKHDPLYVGPCVLRKRTGCDGRVYTDQAAFPVTGWEQLRDSGGANAILDRQRDDSQTAHVRCVKQLARQHRDGINDEQGDLFG